MYYYTTFSSTAYWMYIAMVAIVAIATGVAIYLDRR